MLPFEPEPIESLRSRYAAALEKAYEATNAITDPSSTPGNNRSHVFDFEDGIRLIVSRDYYKAQQVTHVSASFNGSNKTNAKKFIEDARQCFLQLSGKDLPDRTFITANGIPHWFIDTELN